MGVSQIGSLLSRLETRGAIAVPDGRPTRPKRYQLSERLYNIYWLLRRHGEAAERVRGLIAVMEAFYPRRKIPDLVAAVAWEACNLDRDDRGYHIAAYEQFVTRAGDHRALARIWKRTPNEFWELPNLSPKLQSYRTAALAAKAGNNPAELEASLKRVLGQNPNDASAWFTLAIKCYFRMKRFGDAIEALERAARLSPETNFVWWAWGYAAMKSKGFDKALEIFREGLGFFPNDSDLWMGLGQSELVLGQKEAAVKSLERGLRLNPENAYGWVSLGVARKALRAASSQVEEAFRLAVKHDPKIPYAWSGLADVLAGDLKKHEEAEAAYRKALALEPKNADSKLGLANVLVGYPNRAKEAVSLFKAFLRTSPDHSKAAQGLIRAILAMGEKDQIALDLAESWLSKHPDDLFYRVEFGTLAIRYQRKELYSTARRYVADAYRINPVHEVALLASTVCLATEDNLAALEYYRLALVHSDVLMHYELAALRLPLALVRGGLDAAEILRILEESTHAPKLEALIAAFRLYLKKEVSVPTEVLNVAEDILQTINNPSKEPEFGSRANDVGSN